MFLKSWRNRTTKTFDNGVMVFDRYLIEEQQKRYAKINLHEPVEEQWILDVCRGMPNSSFKFWDVGAGIGYYSLLLARQFPHSIIEAFEPLGYHADAIEHHIVLNNIERDRISINRAAVGKEAGRSRLLMQHFGSVLVDGEFAGSTVEVPIVSIDSLLRDKKIEVDLIKVDVQGQELAVIQGAQRSANKVRNWIIGTHGDAVHAACDAALIELGYSVTFSAPRVDDQPDGLIVASQRPLTRVNA